MGALNIDLFLQGKLMDLLFMLTGVTAGEPAAGGETSGDGDDSDIVSGRAACFFKAQSHVCGFKCGKALHFLKTSAMLIVHGYDLE